MTLTLTAVSLSRLGTCHQHLRDLVKDVAEFWPLNVKCGHRTKAEQDAAVAKRTSRVSWPHGKHNSLPSLAVDIEPQNLSKDEKKAREELTFLAGLMIATARKRGVSLRWGGNWDMDYDIVEHEPGKDSWDDMYHFELILS